jgi:hypothetical protein
LIAIYHPSKSLTLCFLRCLLFKIISVSRFNGARTMLASKSLSHRNS